MIKKNIVYNIDCIEGLKTLPDNCIDCCVTSPPYYALRDYGVDGQIGLEETPEEYIRRLTEVFTEVKRVMKTEGTLWLNIGDSYNGSGGNHKDTHKNDSGFQGNIGVKYGGKGAKVDELKPKDLIGIPWMLAFSLRNSGWYLRQDIIWHKPNPMPESVTDRCTKSHEYIFLMSKSQRYYFDHEAIQEEAVTQIDPRIGKREEYNGIRDGRHGNGQRAFVSLKTRYKFGGTKYGENDDKHFQTYSGKEWIPKTKNCMDDGQKPNTMHLRREQGFPDEQYVVRNKRDVWSVNVKPDTVAHFATYPEELIRPCILAGCPKDGIVLDPFMGSGTTARVAMKLDRNYIGFELNPEYCKIIKTKTREIQKELFT